MRMNLGTVLRQPIKCSLHNLRLRSNGKENKFLYYYFLLNEIVDQFIFVTYQISILGIPDSFSRTTFIIIIFEDTGKETEIEKIQVLSIYR